MTAEIAIMNKEAIALATDSAATLLGAPEQKIFTSSNKLFSLSTSQLTDVNYFFFLTTIIFPVIH